MCNNAQLREGNKIIGHPTEGAMLSVSHKVRVWRAAHCTALIRHTIKKFNIWYIYMRIPTLSDYVNMRIPTLSDYVNMRIPTLSDYVNMRLKCFPSLDGSTWITRPICQDRGAGLQLRAQVDGGPC